MQYGTSLTRAAVALAIFSVTGSIYAADTTTNTTTTGTTTTMQETTIAAQQTTTGFKTTKDGLQYKVITPGTGAIPTDTDLVTVNYTGKLKDGTVFDTTDGKQAATFPVNGLIKGWTEALKMMPVGSKWQLIIPADLAYGEHGAPPAIGPNQTLYFDVELVKIDKKA